MHCPDCNSECCIPWDDGYLCCSCGTEFNGPNHYSDSDSEEEDEEEDEEDW